MDSRTAGKKGVKKLKEKYGLDYFKKILPAKRRAGILQSITVADLSNPKTLQSVQEALENLDK